MKSAEALELLDLVRGHLAEPVDLYLRTSFSINGVYGPNFVRLAVGVGWMEAALKRSVAVTETGMAKGVSDETPTLIDEAGSEVRILHWHQEVDAEYVRVVGWAPKDHGSSTSPWLSLQELAHAISAMRTGHLHELDQVGANGGALFFDGEDDALDLIDVVREQVPEVVARQTQMELATQIRTSAAAESAAATGAAPGAAPGAPGGATPARRRPRL